MSAVEAAQPLEAHEPPEARGFGRDDVGLLVATRHDGALVHASFADLPQFLEPGDLLVVNTSATLPSAIDARLGDRPVELRLSTPAAGGSWVVELRGYTYHNDQTSFVLNGLLDHIASVGAQKKAPWPLAAPAQASSEQSSSPPPSAKEGQPPLRELKIM